MAKTSGYPDYTRKAAVDRTEQSGPGALPLGSSSSDLELAIRMNREQFYLLYPRVKFTGIDRAKVTPHSLYQEQKFKPFYSDSVLVPCLFLFNPGESLLTRYGLEFHKGALATFSVRVLEELHIDPKEGDKIELDEI
jgi:hypothetical protein